ncbi:MAG: UDP-3-O-acyl-N-acetylglucosamine deacetylase [Candidatus Gastranaerophilales bacterium]|nr:UDP-3-O-acyl-N-acetylglucosamine deacetylase [Candidatus Gastranaerophilales bacterium]
MKTLKSNLKLQGAGLMFAAPVELEIKPSDKKGIRFHIQDGIVEACVENVVSTEHCVVLADVQNGAKYKIALVEHFMAACAICEIDALDVYFSSQGFEMPIFDGSALVWVEKFNEVGFIGESDEVAKLNKPITFEKDNIALSLIPSQNDTKITYAVNFNHPDLNNRWITLEQEKNINEIIEARTFGYLKDLERFQAAGYSKGVTIENTVGLTDDGYTTELRSIYEPVKHKVLDIIGDLYLTGFNPLKINANILVKEAGHAIHVQVAKELKKVLMN